MMSTGKSVYVDCIKIKQIGCHRDIVRIDDLLTCLYKCAFFVLCGISIVFLVYQHKQWRGCFESELYVKILCAKNLYFAAS